MASGNASGDGVVFRAPQRQRGRDRVASLLTAAASVFAEKGFEAATMTEVAARGGASIGTLYLFFPTKIVLAQTLSLELGTALSEDLEALKASMAGRHASSIADALFDTLFRFVAEHPVFAILLDLPGSGEWQAEPRARRRGQIAQLFHSARPALPAGQPERLALIVPQLMRITLTLAGDMNPRHDAVRQELRTMLHHHLAWRDR